MKTWTVQDKYNPICADYTRFREIWQDQSRKQGSEKMLSMFWFCPYACSSYNKYDNCKHLKKFTLQW